MQTRFVVSLRSSLLIAGSCQVLTSDTFVCHCASGWDGRRCETRVGFCRNILCKNGGVYRNEFMNYTCECLGESYSGRHCEIESETTKILKTISLSMAYIGIIVIIRKRERLYIMFMSTHRIRIK